MSKLKLNEKMLACVLVIYLICAPNVSIISTVGWHDQQRIGEIVLFVILFVISLVTGQSKSVLGSMPKVITCAIGLFFWLGLISSLNAEYVNWALIDWAMLALIFFNAIYIANVRFNSSQVFDRMLVWIFIAACAIYVVSFFARYATLFSGIALHSADLLGGFDNVRSFGQFQTMTLPVLAAAILVARSAKEKYCLFFLLSIWWMLSILSGTRATWFSILFVIGLLAIIGGSAGRAWAKLQISAIFVAIGLYAFFFFLIPLLANVNVELVSRLSELSTLSGRDILWNQAWNMIRNHPLLGIGPMHFSAHPNGIAASPHNIIFQIAAEWGVPAWLFFSGVIFYSLLRFGQIVGKSKEVSFDSVIRLSLFAVLVAASVEAFVDGILVTPYSQVILMFVSGWSIGVYYVASHPNKEFVERKNRDRSLVAINAFVMLIFIWNIAPTTADLKGKEDRYIADHGNLFFPRFWRQGLISSSYQ